MWCWLTATLRFLVPTSPSALPTGTLHQSSATGRMATVGVWTSLTARLSQLPWDLDVSQTAQVLAEGCVVCSHTTTCKSLPQNSVYCEWQEVLSRPVLHCFRRLQHMVRWCSLIVRRDIFVCGALLLSHVISFTSHQLLHTDWSLSLHTEGMCWYVIFKR